MNFVIDHFEESSSLFPDNHAIILEDGRVMSYKTLNDLSSKASKIISKIIGPEVLLSAPKRNETSLIGLLMERTPSIITMFLAIHKAGCAYVPIDPAFPPDRQQYILEHSQCNLMITDELCWTQISKSGLIIPAKHILVSDLEGNFISYYINQVLVPIKFDNEEIFPDDKLMEQVRIINKTESALSYVLYTSGSTGKPKGVAVKQIGLENVISFFSAVLKVNEQTKVMCITTFCFDISELETYIPLTTGGSLVLATSLTRKDPFRIIDLINKYNVTVFQATPTTYEMMLATGWTGDKNVKFLVGGEAFRSSLLPIANNCSDYINVYGPTETTIWSTYFRITQDIEQYQTQRNISAIPIGQAISQTELYLVSEKEPWKEVHIGEEGELWIGGIGVALGYLHSPQLTQDRFILNPFDPSKGFVYRTGDVVKQLFDGNYIFLRRLDDQVKIDGFRIELEEIEKIIMQDEDVEQAVALVRERKLIVYLKMKAYIPFGTRTEMTPYGDYEKLIIEDNILERILSQAKNHLPHYMIPKFLFVVREFAKTPNGKLDRKALPTPLEMLESIIPTSLPKPPIVTPPISSSFDILQGYRYQPASEVICDAIEKLRGNRPNANSNLGAFGLDSLGSVMLLRQITVAFNSQTILKLDELFIPGATIRSLGKMIYYRLSPKARDALKLIPESSDDHETIVLRSIEEGNNIIDESTEVIEDSFGTLLLANKRMIEGLRGIFAFMVLWNHWHYHYQYYNPAFNVDTTLFFMISGFTTASQLRVVPQIQKKGDEYSVEPKAAFNVGKFYLIRAVGLFPILWLNLILNSPRWRDQDRFLYTNHEKGLPQSTNAAVCTALYVFGMDVWSPFCVKSGPDVRYPSELIINMIVYGLFHYFWGDIQRYLMTQWININVLCQQTKGFQVNDVSLISLATSWKEYIGYVMVYLSYNLYHQEVYWKYLIGLPVVIGLILWEISALLPKIVTNIEYFFISAFLLSLCEMTCHQRMQCDHQTRLTAEDIPSPYTLAIEKLHKIFKTFRSFFYVSSPSTQLSQITNLNEHDLIERTNEDVSEKSEIIENKTIKASSEMKFVTWTQRMDQLFRQFSPDVIVIACGFALSKYGGKLSSNSLHYLQFMAMPLALLLFLFLSLNQRRVERFNFSRFLLESDILNILGYCSYPIYLTQSIFLNYYFPLIFGSEDNNYHYHSYEPMVNTFSNVSIRIKIPAMIMLISLCYVIQKYFQDYVITMLFSKALIWYSTGKNQINENQKAPN